MDEKIRYIHEEEIHNFKAAREVLPLVFELVKPASVIDVGCGTGTWLKVAQDLGISDILGVDGDYVDRRLLKMDTSYFKEADLEKPFQLQRKFDLAICLEVAEHLKQESASSFVASLTAHADVILFSAALPGQGGQNHVNEQWPSYWQNLFRQNGFKMQDVIRWKIWNNEQVDWWYRQNIFLVVKAGHPLDTMNDAEARAVIHPELFEIINMNHEKKSKQLKAVIIKLSNRDWLGRLAGVFKSKKADHV